MKLSLLPTKQLPWLHPLLVIDCFTEIKINFSTSKKNKKIKKEERIVLFYTYISIHAGPKCKTTKEMGPSNLARASLALNLKKGTIKPRQRTLFDLKLGRKSLCLDE
jgi:hypothetical protein